MFNTFSSSGKATVRANLEKYARRLRHKWPRRPVVLCLPGRDGIDLPIYRKLHAKIHAVEREHITAKYLRKNNSDVTVHEYNLANIDNIGKVHLAFLDFCGYLGKDNLQGLKRVVELLQVNSLLAVTFVATRWLEKYQELSSQFGNFRKPYEASAHILADVLPFGYGLYDIEKYVYWSKRGFTMVTVMGTFDRALFGTSKRELESAWIKA